MSFTILWTTLGIGSIVVAVLGWLGLKSVMIANLRQAWINALREDLAQFFASIHRIYFEIGMLKKVTDKMKGEGASPESIIKMMRDRDTSPDGDAARFQEAQQATMLEYRRILMRLNKTEPLHQQLERTLEPLLTVSGDMTMPQKELDGAVSLAREVLKREWEVTKYGMFTTPAVWFKNRWKRLFG